MKGTEMQEIEICEYEAQLLGTCIVCQQALKWTHENVPIDAFSGYVNRELATRLFEYANSPTAPQMDDLIDDMLISQEDILAYAALAQPTALIEDQGQLVVEAFARRSLNHHLEFLRLQNINGASLKEMDKSWFRCWKEFSKMFAIHRGGRVSCVRDFFWPRDGGRR